MHFIVWPIAVGRAKVHCSIQQTIVLRYLAIYLHNRFVIIRCEAKRKKTPTDQSEHENWNNKNRRQPSTHRMKIIPNRDFFGNLHYNNVQNRSFDFRPRHKKRLCQDHQFHTKSLHYNGWRIAIEWKTLFASEFYIFIGRREWRKEMHKTEMQHRKLFHSM